MRSAGPPTKTSLVMPMLWSTSATTACSGPPSRVVVGEGDQIGRLVAVHVAVRVAAGRPHPAELRRPGRRLRAAPRPSAAPSASGHQRGEDLADRGRRRGASPGGGAEELADELPDRRGAVGGRHRVDAAQQGGAQHLGVQGAVELRHVAGRVQDRVVRSLRCRHAAEPTRRHDRGALFRTDDACSASRACAYAFSTSRTGATTYSRRHLGDRRPQPLLGAPAGRAGRPGSTIGSAAASASRRRPAGRRAAARSAAAPRRPSGCPAPAGRAPRTRVPERPASPARPPRRG